MLLIWPVEDGVLMVDALRAPIMAAMSGGETSMMTRGLLTAALLFPFFTPVRRRSAIKRWSRDLLRILHIKLHVHGEPPPARAAPVMLVANHVSWLDIFAINAVRPVRFVAKSEVRKWPAIGWLSAKTGTLFIERARRRDTVRISSEIVEAMCGGDVVAVFPEGTTTDGSQVLRFHSSLLQPALQAQAQVYPVALRFERGDGSLCVEAAYDGDKSLWDSFLLMVAQPVMHAQLWFLPPLAADAEHRRTLAASAQQLIADRLR